MTQTRLANELKIAAPTKGSRPANILPLTFDLHGIDSIKKELQKLSATNQELLRAFQTRPELPPVRPKDFGSSGNIVLPADADALANYKKTSDQFKKENEQLRQRIAELEAMGQVDTPSTMKELQEEFERILDEKTESIRTLHMRIQELQDALRGSPDSPGREQLDARQKELEHLEKRLRNDEESLESQAREMEMTMAKERADLARQRADLLRLQADVQREVEFASRDTGLRERLVSLQRRSDGRPRSAATLGDINLDGVPTPGARRRPSTMAAIDLDADAKGATPQKSGLFRRLFGG